MSTPTRLIIKNNSDLRRKVEKYLDNRTRADMIARYGYIGTWDTSRVTNMSELFCPKERPYLRVEFMYFNEDISGWNVSNVTKMKSMFDGAMSFNQPLDNWDISKVTDMSEMFYEAKSFNQPLNNWNVSNVTNMRYMFYGAESFDQPLTNWNVKTTRRDINDIRVEIPNTEPYENMFFMCPINAANLSESLYEVTKGDFKANAILLKTYEEYPDRQHDVNSLGKYASAQADMPLLKYAMHNGYMFTNKDLSNFIDAIPRSRARIGDMDNLIKEFNQEVFGYGGFELFEDDVVVTKVKNRINTLKTSKYDRDTDYVNFLQNILDSIKNRHNNVSASNTGSSTPGVYGGRRHRRTHKKRETTKKRRYRRTARK